MMAGVDEPVLRVGCPMWAHRPWVGSWFPPGTRTERLLEAYAGLLDAVEGNTTFYALPDARTVRRWAEQAPASFRFAFKLPRRITHERRLRDCAAELTEFLDRLGPLADRMGPTSVQLPPSFGPDDLPVLADFLAHLPREPRWAVEVRHRAFFAGGGAERPLDDLLATHGVNRVVMDARAVHAGPRHTDAEREEVRSKPRLPVRPVATGTNPVVRFIGQTDPEANPPFWTRWVEVCTRWIAEGREPYVFLHTPDNAASPGLARRFHGEVAGTVPELRPLPGGAAGALF